MCESNSCEKIREKRNLHCGERVRRKCEAVWGIIAILFTIFILLLSAHLRKRSSGKCVPAECDFAEFNFAEG